MYVYDKYNSKAIIIVFVIGKGCEVSTYKHYQCDDSWLVINVMLLFQPR